MCIYFPFSSLHRLVCSTMPPVPASTGGLCAICTKKVVHFGVKGRPDDAYCINMDLTSLILSAQRFQVYAPPDYVNGVQPEFKKYSKRCYKGENPATIRRLISEALKVLDAWKAAKGIPSKAYFFLYYYGCKVLDFLSTHHNLHPSDDVHDSMPVTSDEVAGDSSCYDCADWEMNKNHEVNYRDDCSGVLAGSELLTLDDDEASDSDEESVIDDEEEHVTVFDSDDEIPLDEAVSASAAGVLLRR